MFGRFITIFWLNIFSLELHNFCQNCTLRIKLHVKNVLITVLEVIELDHHERAEASCLLSSDVENYTIIPDWKVCFLRAEDIFPVKFARLEKPPSQRLRICNGTFLKVPALDKYIFKFCALDWPLRAWQIICARKIFSVHYILSSLAIISILHMSIKCQYLKTLRANHCIIDEKAMIATNSTGSINNEVRKM